jgi:branched-subunit amino acid aminotransferase/4-amino-4-deoxychorismate lyase
MLKQFTMLDIYIDGKFTPMRDARVSALDAGLLFGAGLFETLLAVDGTPRLLPRHLARLRSSGKALGIPFAKTDEESEAIIVELLQRNALSATEARVKILATPGDTSRHYTHRDATLIVTAEAYVRPPLNIPWKLTNLEMVHASSITQHKSTSYLAYRHGLHAARVDGFDDGILLDRLGNVAETTFASLLLFENERLIIPESPDALPSISTGVMESVCLDLGMAVQRMPVRLNDILGGMHVCVCNALLGPFPVSHIDTTDIVTLPDEQLRVLREAWLAFS